MNNTPQWIRKFWQENPATICERWRDGNCAGRLTKEHCFLYAGKQVQELWAIIDLCWYHHLGGGLDKQKNENIAMMNMSDDDLKEAEEKYPRTNWRKGRAKSNP